MGEIRAQDRELVFLKRTHAIIFILNDARHHRRRLVYKTRELEIEISRLRDDIREIKKDLTITDA